MEESKNLIEVKDMKIHFQQKGGKVVKAVDGITFPSERERHLEL